ncbi:hypothetical protein KDA14_03010 [Candidatus Saccharibacteria bacterium]|nr:hypothetical protein [Candidatus Saccharibacteria bacterium]
MRRVAKRWFLVVACALVVQAGLPAHTSAARDVTFSQTIRPLVCTVDIVDDGSVPSVSLSPAKCAHSPEARELLEETRATINPLRFTTQ